MRRKFNFNNKGCLVVGASSGLGLEIVKELLEKGSEIIAASRNTKSLLMMKQQLPDKQKDKLHIIKTDVTEPKQLEKLVDFTKNTLDNISLFINTSGIALYKSFLSLSDSEIKTVIDVNFTGAIMLLRKILPIVVRSKGKKYVVQIGSLAGIKIGHKNFSVYSATKEGLAGLFRSLISEFKDEKIKFILVCPTGMNTNIAKKAIGSKKLREKFSHSNLDSTTEVARGILDNLESQLVDDGIRLLPTKKSRLAYEKL